MGSFNNSRDYIIWMILVTIVGISCYYISINAFRDVMPSRYSPLMTNELLTILHNKEKISEKDKLKIMHIIDRRGYGIRSLGIVKNIDRTSGILEILKQAIFVYPNKFDVTSIDFSSGTYGNWTFIIQKKKVYKESAILKGYSRGLFFLTIAIILYGFMSWFGLKKRRFKLRWIELYIFPQLIAVIVFIFTYIRVY